MCKKQKQGSQEYLDLDSLTPTQREFYDELINSLAQGTGRNDRENYIIINYPTKKAVK